MLAAYLERQSSRKTLNLRNPRQRREYPQDGVEVGDRVADQQLIILANALTVIRLLQPSACSRSTRSGPTFGA